MNPGDFRKKLIDLDKELKVPKLFGLSEIKRCLLLCENEINTIKRSINNYSFESKEGEISFFKNIVSEYVSRLFYYHTLFKVESNMPVSSQPGVLSYLNKQVDMLDSYYQSISSFIRYIKQGETYNDEKYFIRKKVEFYMLPQMDHYALDNSFWTPHLILLGRYKASRPIYQYLEKKITGIENNAVIPEITKLPWNGSKANLVELIYALCESGEVDCSVAQLTKAFENLFDLELGNVYRTYEKLRIRKKAKTPFLTSLIEKLEKRMMEYD